MTRLSIVLDGRNTAQFRIVHGVLLGVSLAFAVALGIVGVRLWRDSKGPLRLARPAERAEGEAQRGSQNPGQPPGRPRP